MTENIIKSLKSTGKIIRAFKYKNKNKLVEKCIAILETTGNLRLIGETGTGKSTAVYAIASALNEGKTDKDAFPLWEKGLSRDVSKWDLVGSDILKNGKTEFREGIVVQWLKSKRGILHLTGFNYAEQSVIGLLETVADFTASLYVDELSETLTRTNDHYLIISFNPSEKSGYSGTNTDNIATIRRFEGLNVYYLDEQTEKELMLENMETLNSKNHRDAYEFCAKMVSLANKVRTLYMDGQLKSPITTGNLINYAKMMDQTDLTDSDIIEIASTLFRESERELFKNLYEETAKETTKINP